MPSPPPESRISPPRRRSRSRSRSPRRDDADRTRSRSPPRGPKQKSYSGLKWKKQDRRDDNERNDRRPGFRDPGRYDDRRRDDRDRGYPRRDERDRGDRFQDRDRRDYRNDRNDRDDRRGGRFDSDRPPAREERERKPRAEKEKEKEKPKLMAAPIAGQEMIIVTVNDRLGTKAQIPCLASDPIKVFKAMVAARIGRAPHEIMLKRQGERPMKDQLTLEDYGVSNGVQLDLELDTGD